MEELTVKLGKEDEAKDQAGEEQAPEETDLKDQVSSFISDQVKPGEAQSGEGMNQGSKGSPRMEQPTMAQQPPVPLLIESSMPNKSTLWETLVPNSIDLFLSLEMMVYRMWTKIMVRQKDLENGEVSNGEKMALPEPAEQQKSEEEEGE